MDIKVDPFNRQPPQPFTRWKYDPTITLGHLLTVITLLFAVVTWGFRLEARIDGHDQALIYWRNQFGDIKQSLIRIEDRINKMTDTQNGGR